jgi:REP element-mobilizing transposase RayT
MKFYNNEYYHLYNRTNSDEALFRSRENYLYFLKKYRFYLDGYFETIAYCLMPTHFHFLVRVKDSSNQVGAHLEGGLHLKSHLQEDYSRIISDKIGIFLSSYTKAFNKLYNRHGSLFQEHSNAKLITEEKYYIALAIYIHQNPLRRGLVEKAEEWEFSSYQDYIELRKGSLPQKELLLSRYSVEDLKSITNKIP